MANLQPRPFEQTEATRVDRDETGAVDGIAQRADEVPHFAAAEHDGKLLLPLRACDLEDRPLASSWELRSDLSAEGGSSPTRICCCTQAAST
jgi:hypothetical protein